VSDIFRLLNKIDNKNYNASPDSFDWRDKNAVTQVYDQGSLGSCWAFSTSQSIESANFIKHNQLVSLSVEQLLECDNTADPKQDHADCGVFGGWP